MAFSSVAELLTSLNLETLIPHFENQCVDLPTLLVLNDSELKELIPQLGARKKISIFLRDTRSEDSTPISEIANRSWSSVSTVVLDENFDVESIVHDNSDITDVLNDSSAEAASSERPGESLDTCSDVPSKRWKGMDRFFPNDQTFMDFVKENSKLNIIKKNYLTKGCLQESDRRRLVAICIDRLLDRHCSVKRDMLQELAHAICKEFPSETVATYFSYNPSVTKNARGKLCDRYHNELKLRKRYSSSCETLPSEGSTSTDKNVSICEVTSEMKRKIQWLKHSQEPWDEVLLYWTETYPVRRMQSSEGNPLHCFIKNWPLLQHDNGHCLINVDFELGFPNKGSLLFSRWTEVSEVLLGELKSAKCDVPDSFDNEDSKNFFILSKLPSLLPAGICKISRTHQWKPSLVECCNYFFQTVSSVQEMQEVLRQREATCFQHKTTLQPCMFKVASGDQQPTYYLSLNKIRYRFATCIKTLDISTKLHQVLDLQYMHQSSQAYTLIQKSCFGIDTVVDRVSPALSVLLEKCSKI